MRLATESRMALEHMLSRRREDIQFTHLANLVPSIIFPDSRLAVLAIERSGRWNADKIAERISPVINYWPLCLYQFTTVWLGNRRGERRMDG